MNITRGHPARFNDKMLVLFDVLVNELRGGKYNDKKILTMFDFDDKGEVLEVLYKSCYVLIDSGYLH